MDAAELLQTRADETTRRLQKLRADLAAALAVCEPDFESPSVCIYATGSLARLEATNHSDLDAFFYLSGTSDTTPLSRIREVRILNAVVDVAEANGFPDFSNDGEYLRFLHADDVITHIGGRSDDYHNAFTARMLLVLESQYLYKEDEFRRCRSHMIESYFKDFHDHSKNFQPIFLLNDILRFWRTMCLNYENGREWRIPDAEKSAKGHLANLKLRFSRLNICYSFIGHLLSKGSSLLPRDVEETAELTPLDRLRDLAKRYPVASEDIDLLLREYAWFLDKLGGPKREVLKWISDRNEREAAFAHSRAFVETMGSVVQSVAEENGYLRYLIV